NRPPKIRFLGLTLGGRFKKAALPGGFFIVALPHPCNKLHTIKLEEKENLKNLYVTEQQIVRFAWFVLMFGKSIFRPTFDS
uniref:hypothetical protein n=2 Tax=Phascolarctobacterium succinatutens TaxID=626940 RepID=UPI0024905F7A